MEKLLGSLFFYSLTLAAFCQNNKILLLKDLPIIYNLDSLEKDVAETNPLQRPVQPQYRFKIAVHVVLCLKRVNVSVCACVRVCQVLSSLSAV